MKNLSSGKGMISCYTDGTTLQTLRISVTGKGTLLGICGTDNVSIEIDGVVLITNSIILSSLPLLCHFNSSFKIYSQNTNTVQAQYILD